MAWRINRDLRWQKNGIQMKALKQPKIERILKNILRLNLARQDFLGVKLLAEQLVANPIDPLSPLFRPYMAGIVTTYARGFVRNDGIGRLDESFTNFSDGVLEDTHHKLLRLRHAAYAHRDASGAVLFSFAEPGVRKSYKLQARIDDNARI